MSRRTKTLTTLSLFVSLSFSLLLIIPDSLFSAQDDILLQTRQLIRQGEYETAISLLTAYIDKIKSLAEQRKNLTEAYYIFAKIHYEIGEVEIADANIKKVLDIFPDFKPQENDLTFLNYFNKVCSTYIPISFESPDAIGILAKGTKKKFPWLIVGGAVLAVSAIVIALINSNKKESPSSVTSLTITSPNGSENWQVDSIHNITWTSTGSITSISIEYSTNNGTAWTVVTGSAENNGSYAWTIPNTPSTSCLVRISNAADAGVNDSSNGVFSISTTAPSTSITVIAPNGGESLQIGTDQNITWTSTGSITNVKIEYSTNSGSSWNIITGSAANTGNYSWTIPNTPSSTCLVRLSDAANAGINDTSNGVFSITSVPSSDSITVMSPNGGESWQVGTNQNLTWISTGSIANVKVEYSTNSGSSWNIITGSAANTGNYSWTIPNTPSSTCLTRVSDAANAGINDTSNGVFSITEGSSNQPIINLAEGANQIAYQATFSFKTVVIGNSKWWNFYVYNLGTANLYLYGNPKIQISGANSDQFSLYEVPNSPIAPGGSTTFKIIFVPTSVGVKNAVVSIPNNDTTKDPFIFYITGTGSV